jgi:hypothetical protein
MQGYTRKKLEQLRNELTEKVLVKNADKEIRLHRIYTIAANVNINRLVRKKGKKSLVGAFQLSHCNDPEENSGFNQNSPL